MPSVVRSSGLVRADFSTPLPAADPKDPLALLVGNAMLLMLSPPTDRGGNAYVDAATTILFLGEDEVLGCPRGEGSRERGSRGDSFGVEGRDDTSEESVVGVGSCIVNNELEEVERE